EVLPERVLDSRISTLILSVDLLRPALTDEIPGYSPEHGGPPLVTDVRRRIQLGQEGLVEHDLYCFHVGILCGLAQWVKAEGRANGLRLVQRALLWSVLRRLFRWAQSNSSAVITNGPRPSRLAVLAPGSTSGTKSALTAGRPA